jgi:hypothetical protein
MAKTLLGAINTLHQRIANAQVGSNSSGPTLTPDEIDRQIKLGQQQLITALRTHPEVYLKKMTGTGK